MIRRIIPLICMMALSIPARNVALAQDAAPPPASVEQPATTEPAATETPSRTEPPATTQPPSTTEPVKPKLISLSFKDMSIEQIGKFLSENCGKPVIVHQSVKDRKVTIVSTESMPLAEAMLILREALRQHEVFIEEQPRLLTIRPISDARQSLLPIITEDVELSTIVDKATVVNKVFAIKHYDVLKLKDAILPMVPEFGHVMADPNTRKLVVVDSVANLERIAQVIAALDVPLADQTLTKIIELEHADATWVISILQTLVGNQTARSGADVANSPGAGPGDESSRRGGGPPPGNRNPAPSAAIARGNTPVLLMPEVSRNWIIAVAPADMMSRIATWIKELDRPDNDQTQFSIFLIKFADPEQVVQYMRQALEALPGQSDTARIVPFPQQRRMMVFGSQRARQFIADLLAKVDVEGAGDRVMKVIELKYADAEQVAENIETLFGSQSRSGNFPFFYGSGRNSSRVPATGIELKVTADTRRNNVTVLADAATLAEIETMVREQWDLPLAPDDVQPKVYVLQNADALQMKELLESLFSQQEDSSSRSPWWYGYDNSSDKTTPVGRLYGQFSFQTLPESNRLIVTTKNADNYRVIDQLIADLDQPQEAGLPRVIELKHAHAEDLAEQLNAILAESGTLAQVTRSVRELSTSGRSMSVSEATNNDRNNQPQQRNYQPEGQRDPNALELWWQRSRDRPEDRQPTSNLIGKVRVVPINRRNALLVMAPKGYAEPMHALIQEMDLPGMQVIVHAIIAEIQHDSATTLGVRIASDPTLLADPRLADQSIGGGANLNLNELFGGTFDIGGDTFGRGVVRADVNLNFLIQLLIRKFQLRILFEPKIYTADNQEAEFFDGQDVSIQSGAQFTAEGTINRTFIYVAVGTRLRVRPHITRDGDVALTINLEVSRILPDSTLGNPIFDRRETTTRVIVHNNQTVMLSGIVRQEDFNDVRKLPLLGDLPLLGGLFRSTEKTQVNRELIAFITPRVMLNERDAIETEMKPHREILEQFRDGMTVPDVEGEAAP